MSCRYFSESVLFLTCLHFPIRLFAENIGGPKRILVDNLLTRVKEMLPEEFETDFNVSLNRLHHRVHENQFSLPISNLGHVCLVLV